MIKLLLVDDHPVFRRGLLHVLGDCPDFQIVGEACDGVEAISKATELQPDVVIMDLKMPKVGGVEATAALKQALPQAKVLVLTVSDNTNDLYSIMEAGAQGYLLKSAELESLIAGIEVVAGGNVIIPPIMAARLLRELKQVDNHDSWEEEKDISELTPREKQVMQLVVQGTSNKEIATRLSIGETTVKTHLRTILEKLQVRNRAEAVAKAMAKDLLK